MNDYIRETVDDGDWWGMIGMFLLLALAGIVGTIVLVALVAALALAAASPLILIVWLIIQAV